MAKFAELPFHYSANKGELSPVHRQFITFATLRATQLEAEEGREVGIRQ